MLNIRIDSFVRLWLTVPALQIRNSTTFVLTTCIGTMVRLLASALLRLSTTESPGSKPPATGMSKSLQSLAAMVALRLAGLVYTAPIRLARPTLSLASSEAPTASVARISHW